MQTYILKTFLPPDHSITLQVPSEIPSGEIEIVLHVPEDDGDSAHSQAAGLRDVLAYIERTSPSSSPGRSKEDIDRSIEEERRTWE